MIIRSGDALPIPLWAGSASATYRAKLTDRVEQNEQHRREDTDDEIKDAERDGRRTL